MSESDSDRSNDESHESSAGAPANIPTARPSDEDLDRRDKEKSRPRRMAGPPLSEPDHRDAAAHEPPPSTEPNADMTGGAPKPGIEPEGSSTVGGDAGLPADHAPPKPSGDELDRRDRQKAGPRRMAGPPLGEADTASRGASDVPPPAATDPDE